MTTGLDQFFVDARLRPEVYEALPDEVSVCFRIHGTQGGAWTLFRRHGTLHLAHEDRSRADCRIECDEAVFDDILTGKVNGKKAYLERKVKVLGDVGIALNLLRHFTLATPG